MFADDIQRSFELLDQAIASDPADPFLIWSAFHLCSKQVAGTHCATQDWEQRLLAIDGENSESWIRIAANRYAEGEVTGALEAMRRASTAGETRAYFPEMVEMIERGLAASSDFTFRERVELAFGFAVVLVPGYNDQVRMCESKSKTDVEWAYACLTYGELVERQGKDDMGVAIAQSIQRVALDALGETERSAEVTERIEASNKFRIDSIDETIRIEQLIKSSDVMFSAYLSAVKAGGELFARRTIANEVDRLSKLRPELGCD